MGQVVPFSGSSFDPGSDEWRATTWNWDDGLPVPDVTTVSLNNGAFVPDPPKTPSINPRTVVDPEPHAFAEACFYNVGFGAKDDDGGSAAATVAVIIAGNASLQRGAGYWQTRVPRPRPTAFTETRRQCYLAITRFMSIVFDELPPLSSVAHAFDVMAINQNSGSATQKLDREPPRTTWLNYANGAFDLTKSVDTDGNGVADTPFATVMATAESVRIGPSSDAQKLAQRNILQRINGT